MHRHSAYSNCLIRQFTESKGETVFDPKQLDDLTQRIVKIIPAGIRDVQHDIEKNIKAVLQSTFAKMDLVSREEFDVQAAVLSRTRQKLEALEKQIAELEQRCLKK
jgi:BMFP domain-containing protein YqiC